MKNEVSLETSLNSIRILYENEKITKPKLSQQQNLQDFLQILISQITDELVCYFKDTFDEKIKFFKTLFVCQILNYSDYSLSKESFFSPCQYVSKQYNFNNQGFVYKFSLIDEYDRNMCNVYDDLLQKNQHTLNTLQWPECIAISIISNNSKEQRSYPYDIFKYLVIDNLKAIDDSEFIKCYVIYTLNAFIHINQKGSADHNDYVSYYKASRKWYTYDTQEQKIDVMEKHEVYDLLEQNMVVTMLFYEKYRKK